MSNAELQRPILAFTGERMMPTESDIYTEMYHWQRYQYFRPWYEDNRVIDAASGEGYGTNYASVLASSAIGIDLNGEAVTYATSRYPNAKFLEQDVCSADYSKADVVVSFETIEHLPDPSKFLKALSKCKGRIVISTPNRNTHSPGNKLSDQPHNPFHTIEWTPTEFAELIQKHFPNRRVRFVSQQVAWPGTIREGFDPDAMYCIAVIGEGELPHWPSIGVAVPTHNNWNQLVDALHTLSRSYPGEMHFAITANACDDLTLKRIRENTELPHLIHLIEQPINRGFGIGSNLALEFLRNKGFDLYAVANDDIIPECDAICEMVSAMAELDRAGLNPGVIGPVSNSISGQQQVQVGSFQDYTSLMMRADEYHRSHHSSVTQVLQLRGLLMLITPECLEAVGGFDPRFGIGNFEDDDHNLRCTLAGFTLWIADGAFLFHHGSTTFKKLNVDYEANIQRNMSQMMKKWELTKIEDWVSLKEKPEKVELFIPLGEPTLGSEKYEVKINGESIDLLAQASDTEFAAWVMFRMQDKPNSFRRAVIELLDNMKIPA